VIIGLTGGVGCGKSTVMEIFKNEFNAKVLIADNMGHKAMEPGSTAYEEIVEKFGADILASDGEIDRGKLAEIIYVDDEKREMLNGIVHPFVISEIQKKIKEWETESLIVLETAIMFETGCDKLCDEIWAVITDKETRVLRLMESRGYTRQKAESIMKKQLSDKEIKEKCDKIIYNDGTPQDLMVQMQELLVTPKKM